MSLIDAARFIREHEGFLILCHISPDGDTLGSGLALHAGLLLMGKRSSVCCADPIPQRYSFLPFADRIVPADRACAEDAVICVDISSPDRAGDAVRFLDAAAYTLCIDHHATNAGYAQVNCVQQRGAAGELVYELLREMGVPVNAEIATCLYTAIVTDTGNFAYSSATPETFRIAAEIVATGIPFANLQQTLFHSVPLKKLRLKEIAYRNMRILADGKGAVSSVSLSDFASAGASASDSEGIVEDLRDLDTVCIAAFLREEESCVRLSLRGNGDADVSSMAVALHGGGHRLAAGATLHVPLEKAEDIVTAMIVEML